MLLIVQYSKFRNNTRPFFLSETSKSSYFSHDPNISYFRQEVIFEKEEPAPKFVNTNLIQALEYKERIKNMIKQIVDHRLNKQRIEKDGIEDMKKAEYELEQLKREKERVSLMDREMNKVLIYSCMDN